MHPHRQCHTSSATLTLIYIIMKAYTINCNPPLQLFPYNALFTISSTTNIHLTEECAEICGWLNKIPLALFKTSCTYFMISADRR